MKPRGQSNPPRYNSALGANLSSSPGSKNELYRRLFELMPGGVVVLDAEATVLDANPSFCNQIGYSHAELVGQHVTFFSQDSREAVQHNVARLLAGELLEHEVRNVQKDGTLRHYELRETGITLPDGSRGILTLSSDVTRRVESQQEKLNLERQFFDSEKLKSLGLMAGGIAHDFNNLLAGIVGNIELVAMESDGDPLTRTALQDALSATKRAAALTRQMLEYSGGVRFASVEVNLNEIIRNITELLTSSVARNASLEFEFDDALPNFHGDAAELQQIVISLVMNASESLGGKNGRVTITTRMGEFDAATLAANRTGNRLPPGKYFVLEITDNGNGMDEVVQQKLFDPFFTTKFAGRGLGLSAMLGIVRGHNGGILVNSRVNHGTTMTVLFPAEPARDPVEAESAAKSRPGTTMMPMPILTGTVLVADNELTIRKVVETLLKRTGLRVLLAEDGAEAVELFKQHATEIRFVLLDLTMPKLDGVEVLAELRRIQPGVKAILMSGYDAANVTERSVTEGFVAFIAKPFGLQKLAELAQQICSGKL